MNCVLIQSGEKRMRVGALQEDFRPLPLRSDLVSTTLALRERMGPALSLVEGVRE